METRTFRTDLNCTSCLAKVKPFLDAERAISEWSVDLESKNKLLTVTGSPVDAEAVRLTVAKSGFHVFEEISSTAEPTPTATWKTYSPLLLIFSFLAGLSILGPIQTGDWALHPVMNRFMGGFFLAFSFFKFLNLRGFADAYRTYDIVARALPAYGFVYPFLELGLGVAYLVDWAPAFTNVATILLMGVSSIGVLQSLLKKQTIQCACLGTIFNLPMSKITLFEDLLMVGMAAAALA